MMAFLHKKPIALLCVALPLWLSTFVCGLVLVSDQLQAADTGHSVEYVIHEHMLEKDSKPVSVEKATETPAKAAKAAHKEIADKEPAKKVGTPLIETHAKTPESQYEPASQYENVSSDPVDTYTLGPGDEIDIIVFGERDLSHTYKISGSNTIAMPLLDKVVTKDHTVTSLARHLEDRLEREGIMVKPSVAVQVSSHRPFYILGEVRTPGSYAFVSNMTILNAVALAGGFTYRADRDDVKVLRPDGKTSGTYLEYPVESLVLPGDVILVEERFF